MTVVNCEVKKHHSIAGDVLSKVRINDWFLELLTYTELLTTYNLL